MPRVVNTTHDLDSDSDEGYDNQAYETPDEGDVQSHATTTTTSVDESELDPDWETLTHDSATEYKSEPSQSQSTSRWTAFSSYAQSWIPQPVQNAIKKTSAATKAVVKAYVAPLVFLQSPEVIKKNYDEVSKKVVEDIAKELQALTAKKVDLKKDKDHLTHSEVNEREKEIALLKEELDKHREDKIQLLLAQQTHVEKMLALAKQLDNHLQVSAELSEIKIQLQERDFELETVKQHLEEQQKEEKNINEKLFLARQHADDLQKTTQQKETELKNYALKLEQTADLIRNAQETELAARNEMTELLAATPNVAPVPVSTLQNDHAKQLQGMQDAIGQKQVALTQLISSIESARISASNKPTATSTDLTYSAIQEPKRLWTWGLGAFVSSGPITTGTLVLLGVGLLAAVSGPIGWAILGVGVLSLVVMGIMAYRAKKQAHTYQIIASVIDVVVEPVEDPLVSLNTQKTTLEAEIKNLNESRDALVAEKPVEVAEIKLDEPHQERLQALQTTIDKQKKFINDYSTESDALKLKAKDIENERAKLIQEKENADQANVLLSKELETLKLALQAATEEQARLKAQIAEGVTQNSVVAPGGPELVPTAPPLDIPEAPPMMGDVPTAPPGAPAPPPGPPSFVAPSTQGRTNLLAAIAGGAGLAALKPVTATTGVTPPNGQLDLLAAIKAAGGGKGLRTVMKPAALTDQGKNKDMRQQLKKVATVADPAAAEKLKKSQEAMAARKNLTPVTKVASATTKSATVPTDSSADITKMLSTVPPVEKEPSPLADEHDVVQQVGGMSAMYSALAENIKVDMAKRLAFLTGGEESDDEVENDEWDDPKPAVVVNTVRVK